MAEAAGFDIEVMIGPVLDAGARTLAYRDAGVATEIKADESPVTAADRAAEAILLAALARLAPGIPVVAEEEASAGRVPEVDARFFLVDPLDGTREYVRGGDDFTVNVALVERGAPIAGIVYAPARGRLWCGDVARGVAWRAHLHDGVLGERVALKVRSCRGVPVAVASKSHCTPATEAWLKASGCAERVSVGSSLKFALIAGGEADVYPRPGPTMEWDTAAGDAVLRAAGGHTLCLDGHPLTYAKPRFFNPGFVASGGHPSLPLRPFLTADTRPTDESE
ncbi:3'(2'),5'-bisphosphate nucleotidase CysQ [Sphingomonas metalli]|uniref:3'(2'),5'-bisphosphate nucleotidase CysQ n=1 Tax=Sphingomonas metalli TaxID=1779358 RepID=A0A916TDG7_9SPHN|nr:3'(2'),5'-bisphosphate nucleotidase CysQ [Sphingomonas metalli]GGB39207.1 3'(2'),5'-bisphosphate nucleotidase CysQ [Sphingomonas metalli]